MRVFFPDRDAGHGDDHGLAVQGQVLDVGRRRLRAGAEVVLAVGEQEHQGQGVFRPLGVLLQVLHVGFQPHQGEFECGGDVGLAAPAVDSHLVRVDLVHRGHVAKRVDHGLVVEADQEQFEVGAVGPFRPPRLALHEHFADSLGGRLGLLARHGAAVIRQYAHQLRPRLPRLSSHGRGPWTWISWAGGRVLLRGYGPPPPDKRLRPSGRAGAGERDIITDIGEIGDQLWEAFGKNGVKPVPLSVLVPPTVTPKKVLRRPPGGV